jgi:hypothetical protein
MGDARCTDEIASVHGASRQHPQRKEESGLRAAAAREHPRDS